MVQACAGRDYQRVIRMMGVFSFFSFYPCAFTAKKRVTTYVNIPGVMLEFYPLLSFGGLGDFLSFKYTIGLIRVDFTAMSPLWYALISIHLSAMGLWEESDSLVGKPCYLAHVSLLLTSFLFKLPNTHHRPAHTQPSLIFVCCLWQTRYTLFNSWQASE